MWLLVNKKICNYNITLKIINGIPSKIIIIINGIVKGSKV